jgi:hypothetical protein
VEHKSTREKMAGMSRKEKVHYIWYYYKIHIIGSILLIMAVTSFIVDAVNTKDVLLNVTLMGKYVDSEKLESLEKKTTEELVKDPKNKTEIRYDYLSKSDDPRDQFTPVSLQKLTASVAAADIDILILDKNDFEIYAKQGMFLPLTSIPEFASIDLKDYETIKYSNKENDIKEDIYAINIAGLPILKDISFDTKDKVLGVISNSKHLNKTVEFLNWFFSQASL